MIHTQIKCNYFIDLLFLSLLLNRLMQFLRLKSVSNNSGSLPKVRKNTFRWYAKAKIINILTLHLKPLVVGVQQVSTRKIVLALIRNCWPIYALTVHKTRRLIETIVYCYHFYAGPK
jgi:hypothetical protein